ncbi:FRG domain-containing protein [Carboxylicivirga sp. A043]|uniref:FRG domain-containing protein n=1 Tax=Carboxylicivirga litoralis TaxID=2816963 RepID=UPI0021CB2C6A|nr:FRG domain-containing protein [Carboxylicivirga sp. A043]MCU4158250.1 FRG domain-containing protein [Carboxylicivirga sp. A043]
MSKTIEIESFSDFIKQVEQSANIDNFFMLFRGQSVDKPLLPSIARLNPYEDTTRKEMLMLGELKRRAFNNIDSGKLKDHWDWLVYAQHFGLRTRLLDWSTNPLVALFFACSDYNNSDSYVYLLIADKAMRLRRNIDKSPFAIGATKILRPPQNNERIIAQSGWFTAHAFSKKHEQFISLDLNKKTKNRIKKYVIPRQIKGDIMKKLYKFGINYQTMFPDLEGLCKQVNWEY